MVEVDGVPLRRAIERDGKALTAVEQAVAGRPRNEETAELAGHLAVEGALPLRYNGYKIPLMKNLVRRAIRGGPLTATT